MSITRVSVNGYRIISSLQLHNSQIIPVQSYRSFSFNPLFSNQNRGSLKSRSLQYLRNRGDFAIYNSDHQETVTSFGSFMASNWKHWIVGALVSVILPFFTNKWGPILKWTRELEAAEERLDEIAEAIEKVAVAVEKIAEDGVEHLPEGSKLKAAATFLENAAKEVIKDADIVEDLIHKAEAVEKKVEDIIDGKKEIRETKK